MNNSIICHKTQNSTCRFLGSVAWNLGRGQHLGIPRWTLQPVEGSQGKAHGLRGVQTCLETTDAGLARNCRCLVFLVQRCTTYSIDFHTDASKVDFRNCGQGAKSALKKRTLGYIGRPFYELFQLLFITPEDTVPQDPLLEDFGPHPQELVMKRFYLSPTPLWLSMPSGLPVQVDLTYSQCNAKVWFHH